MNWQLKEIGTKEVVDRLVTDLQVSPVIAQLLAQRGITNFNEAKDYFRPNLNSLHDPFSMKDMEKAVNRLIDAISNNENILIYGDYDVDGSTSVAMFYHFLVKHYKNISYYIPDRYKEGYGVSDASIRYAIEYKVDLIVTIDCGIKAITQVNKAADYNIDFIICDHHTPGDLLPNAKAVLDPKQKDCSYPFKELCGCGVAFKLIQAFCIQNGVEDEEWMELLEFVAIATCCDIVPMIGENRTITYFGLQQLNESKRPGIQAMIELTGYKTPLNVTNIVFGIGPRINAAGRINHAHGAVKLLLAQTDEEAQNLGASVNQLNEERRELDKSITQEAVQMIEIQPNFQELYTSVLFQEHWHKGVIGIVASRCIETHYKPTIILSESNGKLTGSARSVSGFDIYEAINECGDLLEQYGGHKYAAGLTLKKEKFQLFKEKFEKVVRQKIQPHQREAHLKIDLNIKPDEITDSLLRILNQMEPFGPMNMRPVFSIDGARIEKSSVRILKEEHLKFQVVVSENKKIDAIAFGMASQIDILNQGEANLCFTIDLNTYRGISTIQLMIRDIHPIKIEA